MQHFQFFFKLRLFLVSSLIFLFALSGLVVLLLCPFFVLYYFAILPGRRCWVYGVFPTDLVSCLFGSLRFKSLMHLSIKSMQPWKKMYNSVIRAAKKNCHVQALIVI
jgi:hypothetical protein